MRQLALSCLHRDFDLRVELPPNKLIPTIPLRLNYILFIEDLLKYFNINVNEVIGVDIGCGASCVFCLLSVRNNPNWQMIALEIDEENLQFAQENVARNNLDGIISVISQEKSSKIFEKLFQSQPDNKTFCMCNPPFFNSNQELKGVNRTGKRKAPNSLCLGSSSELITEGGELKFVCRILDESIQLQNKIEIYSTMLGLKKNLILFVDRLRSMNIESFTTTEFVQGKTVRWAVAWSFKHNLRLFKDHNEMSKTSKNVLTHVIASGNFKETCENLKRIFSTLQIDAKEIENSKNVNRWELTTTKNTWSNQRRKKRAELNQKTVEPDETKTEVKIGTKIGFELRKEIKSAKIKIFYISGMMNKDCVNQILQFIKNSL